MGLIQHPPCNSSVNDGFMMDLPAGPNLPRRPIIPNRAEGVWHSRLIAEDDGIDYYAVAVGAPSNDSDPD